MILPITIAILCLAIDQRANANVFARPDENTLPPREVDSQVPIPFDSYRPTHSPTDAPTTKRPRFEPTAPPSFAPSASRQPSKASLPPSLVDSGHPTPQPSEPQHICITSILGTFGSTSPTSALIPYHYRIQVKKNTNLNDTLPRLETAISNQLLPSFFPDLCSSTHHTERRLINSLDILGISIFPRDIPQPAASNSCKVSEQISIETECFNVLGKFTLFFGSIVNTTLMDSFQASAQTVIQQSMDTNQLLIADANIIRLTYFSYGPGSIVSSTSNGGLPIPAYGWVIIAIVPLIFLLIAFIQRRKRRLDTKRNHNDQDSSVDSSVSSYMVPNGVSNQSIEDLEDPSFSSSLPDSDEEDSINTNEQEEMVADLVTDHAKHIHDCPSIMLLN